MCEVVKLWAVGWGGLSVGALYIGMSGVLGGWKREYAGVSFVGGVPLHPRRKVYLTCFGNRKCDGKFSTRVRRVLSVFRGKTGVRLRTSASRVYSTYPGGRGKYYSSFSLMRTCSGTILRLYNLRGKRVVRFSSFASVIRGGVLTSKGEGRVYKGYR